MKSSAAVALGTLAAAALLVLLVSGCGGEGSLPGAVAVTVTGKVLQVHLDRNPTPVGGVVVVLLKGGAEAARSAASGADGAYSIPDVSPGSYTVRVENAGRLVLLTSPAPYPLDVPKGPSPVTRNIYLRDPQEIPNPPAQPPGPGGE
jgi:hypothetical protein